MDKKGYTLTRQEIGDAIVEYIAKYQEHTLFYPFRVSGTSPTLNLADEVQVKLEYVPKGTKLSDPQARHNI